MTKKPNGLLSREAILAALDLPEEDLDMPEWGGAVTVRAMSAEDYLEYANAPRETVVQGIIALIAASLIDGEGRRLFAMDDIAALAKKNMTALDRIFRVATRLNARVTGTVEDKEKN